jgi:hypothetical protein
MVASGSQQCASKLSMTIDRRLTTYSATAIAAGVSLLALAAPAKAEIVVTKKTIPIPVTPEGTTLVSISLNNNGVNDFEFSLYSFAYHSAHRTLRMWPLEGGGVMGKKVVSGRSYASELMRGAKIGPSANFNAGKPLIEDSDGFGGYTQGGRTYYTKQLGGSWGNNAKNAYVGVRFLIGGKTHYGWIRMTVTTSQSHGAMSVVITGYAYETVPNKAVTAGETSTTSAQQTSAGPSLGMLARGVDGVALWRKDVQ